MQSSVLPKEIILPSQLDTMIYMLESAFSQNIETFQTTLAENAEELCDFMHDKRFFFGEKKEELIYVIKIFSIFLKSGNFSLIEDAWNKNKYLKPFYFGNEIAADIRFILYFDMLKSHCLPLLNEAWNSPELLSFILNHHSGKVLYEFLFANAVANYYVPDKFFIDCIVDVTENKPRFMLHYYLAVITLNQQVLTDNLPYVLQWFKGDVEYNDEIIPKATRPELIREFEFLLTSRNTDLIMMMIQEVPELLSNYKDDSTLSDVQFVDGLILTLMSGNTDLFATIFSDNPRSKRVIEQLSQFEKDQITQLMYTYFPNPSLMQSFGLLPAEELDNNNNNNQQTNISTEPLPQEFTDQKNYLTQTPSNLYQPRGSSLVSTNVTENNIPRLFS